MKTKVVLKFKDNTGGSMNVKKVLKTLMYYIIMFYVIYVTDSMFFHLNANSNIVDLAQVSILIVMFILLFVSIVRKIKINKQFLTLLVVLSALLMSMLITNDISE